ncbi:hypothetical protein AERO8C_150001 [Aeromonas veronii]|uniref:Uncharacterized protein n=1 Tax=Aeromonas veronii TaxID=654 RepID=A0A653KUN6_AERVE|nr:hypothetical protein AERO8C_150001 [Aeromonas veronii]
MTWLGVIRRSAIGLGWQPFLCIGKRWDVCTWADGWMGSDSIAPADSGGRKGWRLGGRSEALSGWQPLFISSGVIGWHQ